MSGPPVQSPSRTRELRIALALAFVLAFVVGFALATREGDPPAVPDVPAPEGESVSTPSVADFDPFRYSRDRDEDFLERGRDAYAHVVYAKSPGGVEATAARVARYQPLIQTAAAREGVDADTLGALVFLESAGRPEAMAAGNPDGATGLAQIIPGTATALLGMRVDLERSISVTRRIAAYDRRAVAGRKPKSRRIAARRAKRLRVFRRRIDERFDPAKAIDGAARYLAIAQRRFGRADFAAASYHMGIGNLRRVISTYVSPRPRTGGTAGTVARYRLTYPQVFFDSTRIRNPRTYRLLASFGDDSRTYLFRLEAAREIRRMAREDVDQLRRQNELQISKASAEEVLHPQDDTEQFEDVKALRRAYEDGDLVALPNRPRLLGFSIDRTIGGLAPRLHAKPIVYRGLRPDALATLLYIAKETRRILGRGAIRVTSTVRDLGYQELLVRTNPEATSEYSLHTTGYAFDLARDPGSRARTLERALVSVLERLRALRVIDWVYEPTAIHVTVGPDGRRYRALSDALLK